ncbi:HD-GYP domain-containing protein [Desulfosporosinus sp. PR]|nr:HD-GYP domain-containing protein [Desulfosporosinus sp. PR]
MALTIWVLAVFQIKWNRTILVGLLIFGILAIISESMPVALPKGGYVTVSYAVFISAGVLFPLGVSLSVVALGGLLVFGKVVAGEPIFKRIFNASQFVLSLALSYSIIGFTRGRVFQLDLYWITIYFAVALIYMITNMSIVTIALGTMQRKSPWSIWVSNIKWAVPNFMALAPLGLLMALIYNNYGPAGLLLLFVPLLLSRHAFQLYVDMRENYLNTVEALVQALEAKDTYTSGHSARVGKLAVAIAEGLEMSEDKIEFLKYAAVLHDVGKIGVSESILNKEGKLMDPEWKIIRSHPVMGQTIIKNIKFLFDIGQIVRHHHERYDGNGYPDRISREEIPLEARIIAVADTYDAITSNRSYRQSKTHEEAVKELKRVAGSQLDPELVEVFCKVVTSEFTSQMSNTGPMPIASSY